MYAEEWDIDGLMSENPMQSWEDDGAVGPSANALTSTDCIGTEVSMIDAVFSEEQLLVWREAEKIAVPKRRKMRRLPFQKKKEKTAVPSKNRRRLPLQQTTNIIKKRRSWGNPRHGPER